MRSLAGLRPRNATPVPYTSTSRYSMPSPFQRGGGTTSELASTSAVSTLFSIVNRTSGDTARVKWQLWRPATSGKPEDRTEVTQHLALKLWNKWNKFHVGGFGRESVQQHIDLTGEGWLLLTRLPRVKLPMEIWFIRPDRIEPDQSATDFISGYTYHGPNGEKIPLALDEVLRIQLPNPNDPYRGLGPVQSLLTDLDAETYSKEWNRNFFRNSAIPGGLIEVPNNLSDAAFDQFQARWSQTHKGVSNAHRVAMLENGMKWIEQKFTMRDMQFAELRNVSRELIMEAFGINKFMLGRVDDVNRANADAAEYTHMKHLIVPRLDRWKDLANNLYLPLFGDPDLEFDYINPVPEDDENARADRESRANTAAIYYNQLHASRESIAEVLELPEGLIWEEPPAPTIVAPPGAGGAGSEDGSGGATKDQGARHGAGNRGGVSRARAALPADVTDLTAVQEQWQAALNELMTDWQPVSAAQYNQLQVQIEQHVTAQDLAALTALTVSTVTAASVLSMAMYRLALIAARQVVAEAAAQGVSTAAGMVTSAALAPYAATTAELLAGDLTQSAGRQALRLYAPGRRSAADVAAGVREHLSTLSNAGLKAQLGGALTRAQNSARLHTLRIAPLAAYFASETLDQNTCAPCKALHGTEFDSLDQAELTYLGGPYYDCQGWPKCRGAPVASWNEAVA